MRPSFSIPNTMHFIWVGPAPLPNDAIENVTAWATANPKHQIFLWTDISFWREGKDEHEKQTHLFKYYQELFKKNGIDVFNESMEEYSSEIRKSAPVIIKDIKVNKLINRIVEYELYRLDPNFGAVSDITRYQLLEEKGGGYVDCADVFPGKTSLSECSTMENLDTHTIFLDHKSQDPKLSEEDLTHTPYSLKREEIGNDAFFSTPNHPFWKNILEKIEGNYHLQFPKDYEFDDEDQIFDFRANLTYSNFFRQDSTVSLTGPGLISSELEDDQLGTLKIEGPGKYSKLNNDQLLQFYPLRCLDYRLIQPKPNKLEWMYTKVLPLRNQKDEALKRTLQAIQFECEYFQILRLEDHIRLLAQSVGISSKEASEALIPALNTLTLDYSTIQMVQLTYEFDAAEEFYAQHDLLKVSYASLKSEKCGSILSFSSNLSFFNRLVKNNRVTGYFNILETSQIEQILPVILRNIKFIEKLYDRFLKEDKPEATDVVFENLKICKEILLCLQEVLPVFNVDLEYEEDFLPVKTRFAIRELCLKISEHINAMDNELKEQKNISQHLYSYSRQ